MEKIADTLAEGGMLVALDERGDVTSKSVCDAICLLIKQKVSSHTDSLVFQRRLDSERTKRTDLQKRYDKLMADHVTLQLAHSTLQSEHEALGTRAVRAGVDLAMMVEVRDALGRELEKLRRQVKRVKRAG